ncbi:hypothetical protein KQX54_020755 [Cotesia glomerata]|uniref:Secreted protein n=1 Tax=Cotesia glomerata TaxID=32391 RepID=A0AAV7I521_COTGL|nr:hypothetical protein KQX54_020755 [Cotesia glomerata]
MCIDVSFLLLLILGSLYSYTEKLYRDRVLSCSFHRLFLTCSRDSADLFTGSRQGIAPWTVSLVRLTGRAGSPRAESGDELQEDEGPGGQGVILELGFALRVPGHAVREAHLTSGVVRVQQVVHDGEDRAGSVDSQGDPPQELLVQPLLEVLQHQQPDRQPGQSPRQVRHVRDRWTHLLRRVPVVDCEPHVCACWNK